MYEELVKQLRERAAWINFPHHGEEYPTEDAMLMMQAADAIEELSREVDIDNAAMTAMDAAMPRWIPATERPPEDCTPVQVCYIGYYNKEIGSDMLACRYEGTWCYWDGEPCSYDPCRVEITHWMPLLKPPKEDKDDV